MKTAAFRDLRLTASSNGPRGPLRQPGDRRILYQAVCGAQPEQIGFHSRPTRTTPRKLKRRNLRLRFLLPPLGDPGVSLGPLPAGLPAAPTLPAAWPSIPASRIRTSSGVRATKNWIARSVRRNCCPERDSWRNPSRSALCRRRSAGCWGRRTKTRPHLAFLADLLA
jgi:hypothetical protein